MVNIGLGFRDQSFLMLDDNDGLLSNGGINIVHMNVASILGAHKFEMLKQQLESSNVQVFGASESWLSENIPNGLVSVSGFNSTRLDRKWKDDPKKDVAKKGGGLVCYVKEGLEMDDFRFSHLNSSTRDLEMQWVLLNMKNMRNLVIINVYRPPQGDYKKACKLVHSALSKADLKDNVDIFLMGDFNIDLLNKKDPMVKELLATTSFWGLKPFISEVTRMGSVNGVLKSSCIDNIFSNSDNILRSGVLDWNFSDHLAISIKRKRTRVVHTKVEFKGRSYKNYLKEDLQLELLQKNWELFYNSRDPCYCWEQIESSVRVYLDRTCPIKSFRVKEARDPWVTNELLEEIKDKDHTIRVAKRTGKEEDWNEARHIRNRVGRLVEQTKAEFIKEQQAELEGDPKKFWRLIKTIVPGKKAKLGKISLVEKTDSGSTRIVEDSDTADFINEFFSGIGAKLAKNHAASWKFYGDKVEESCPPFGTDYEQVRKLCKEIVTCKSSGFNDISTRVLKDAFMVVIPQLVYLFNLSFATGIFPDCWKEATVIPLDKGGDKTNVGNFRPVSLLPLPGKLIEKIVHARLSTFLHNYDILSEKQGGFRKGFSTAKSVADLTDMFLNNANKGQSTLAVFVDLRKAFDTVDHNILVRKLECYGIDELNLQWCVNYLTNRFQSTLANGKLSSSKEITCGVPQGSVLGPLFFILYVNDMQNAVQKANVQLYADDTVLHSSDKDLDNAAMDLQEGLNQFSVWCHENKLSLNTNKTKQMAFGTRYKVKKTKRIILSVEGKPLQTVPTYKYLGITLDSTLSFNSHVKNVANMVSYKSILLCKIRKFLTEKVALKIYKSMVLPYFDYGDVIYGNANADGLEKLQRLNRCLKICKGYNRRHDTADLHSVTKTPKLKARRFAHLNSFMYSRLKDPLLVDARDIRTRAHDAPLFKIKIPKIEMYKRAVEYSGALQWNDLSPAIRGIENSKLFKTKQKAVMMSTV